MAIHSSGLPGLNGALAARGVKTRLNVAFVPQGQSVIAGPVLDTDEATYPLAFQSARNPTVSVPFSPSPGIINRGGWQCAVYDELYDWGYHLEIRNCAIGSTGVRDWAGMVQSRPNSSAGMFGSRAAAGFPDRGFFGDVIIISDKAFQVSTGRQVYVLNDSPFRITATNAGVAAIQTNLDYRLSEGSTTALGGRFNWASNSSAPDVSSTTAGQTVADGTGFVHTCLATTNAIIGGARFTASIAAGTGSETGFGVMTVTAVGGWGDGNIEYGQVITGTGVSASTYVLEQLTGTAGSTGTYKVSISQTAASTTITSGVAGSILNFAKAKGYGWDPLGLLARMRETMLAIPDADIRIYYLEGCTQTDAGNGFEAGAHAGSYVQMAKYLLRTPGAKVMLGVSTYSHSATTGNYAKAVTGKNWALAYLQSVYGADRVFEGADLYTAMGSTGPMGSGGAYLQADNVHITGQGAVGPATGGVEPAYVHVSAALMAALPQRNV